MEATLDRLVAHSFTLARVSGWICGLLLTLSAFLIGLNIALREIFVVTLGGANELSGYALAVSSSWGCTVALLHRIHVRIDSVYTHLSPRIRAPARHNRARGSDILPDVRHVLRLQGPRTVVHQPRDLARGV